MAKKKSKRKGWNFTDRMDLQNSVVPFVNEKLLCDFIEKNIKHICQNVFGSQYVRHQREYPFNVNVSRNPTVDFLITTKKDIILLEVKNPKGVTQSGVYQLLKYSALAENVFSNPVRLILFSTRPETYDYAVISKFSLPVELYYLSKNRIFSFESYLWESNPKKKH